MRLAANPVRLTHGLPQEKYASPPLLGQHSDEILSEIMGYSKEKIEILRMEEKEHVEERHKHLKKER